VKFNKLIFLFLWIAMVLTVGGCSSAITDPAIIYKDQSAEEIYRGAEINLAKRRYSTAVQQFEALDALYPFSQYSEQAQLDSIYAYYKNDDMPSTAAAADRYIRLYPRSEHVDYAYYMKGIADFEQDRGWLQRFVSTDLSKRDPGTTLQAFDDFSQLVRLFPNSVYAPDARQRMVYLRNLFANHELHIAQYYFARGAYVAAANRANYIVQHFDGTPQVEGALVIMVKSYRELGLEESANKALRVLQLNYPKNKDL